MSQRKVYVAEVRKLPDGPWVTCYVSGPFKSLIVKWAKTVEDKYFKYRVVKYIPEPPKATKKGKAK